MPASFVLFQTGGNSASEVQIMCFFSMGEFGYFSSLEHSYQYSLLSYLGWGVFSCLEYIVFWRSFYARVASALKSVSSD